MSPEAGIERLFHDAVLDLAGRADFARPMVNSGRLSRPCVYPLPVLPAGAKPGSVAPAAPLGGGFTVLPLGHGVAPDGMHLTQPDVTDVIRARYLGDAAQAIYLIRPDQVIAARWHVASTALIAATMDAARKGMA